MNEFVYPETVDCVFCKKLLNVEVIQSSSRVKYNCFCDREYFIAPKYMQLRNSIAQGAIGEIVYSMPHFFLFQNGVLIGYVINIDPRIYARSRPIDFINYIIEADHINTFSINDFSPSNINDYLKSIDHDQLSFMEDMSKEMIENYFML